MRILVVGAGMYVTGRGATGVGTILAALAQFSKHSKIDSVDIVARNPNNRSVVETAVASINKTIASELRCNYFSPDSLSMFIDGQEPYDASIIVVPDHLHHVIGKTLLEKGIHCLIAKPFTPTVAQAQDLIAIQRERNIYGAIEFHKRFDESNLLVKKLIDDGSLGDVKYFCVNYSQRISIPLEVFKTWASKTNIFQYLGCHYVDLIYFLTGAKPMEVTAVGTIGLLSAKGSSTYDSVHAVVRWATNDLNPTGFVSVLNVSWIDPMCSSALSDQKFTLVGSKARMELDQKNRGIELVKDGIGIQHLNPYFSEFLPNQNGDLEFQGYAYKSVGQFLSDIDDLKLGNVSMDHLEKNRPSFVQGLVSTAVVEAVNESLRCDSEWVKTDGIS